MDNNFLDPDDPTTISKMDELVEKELLVENFGPEKLPLEDVLMDEVANHTYHLNRGGLINEAQVDPGYNLLPAPVTNIEDLWGKEGPLEDFLTEDDKIIVSTWVNLNDIDPIDFWPIINGENAIVRSIAVSMFYGLIVPNQKCPNCDGTMKLQVNYFGHYMDKLHWKCCKDGIPQFSNTNPRNGKIKRKTCKKELNIRSDNWVFQLRYPLVNILQAIFYYTKDLAQKDIAQFSRMSRTIIWKISRTLRHIAAKFITKHPQTTKIGGKNCFGQEMYVAIDETACGKRKFNRGRRKKTIWTLGGVEMPDKSHQNGQIPRMFAVTVPNRSRETLLPILLKMIHHSSVIWSDG